MTLKELRPIKTKTLSLLCALFNDFLTLYPFQKRKFIFVVLQNRFESYFFIRDKLNRTKRVRKDMLKFYNHMTYTLYVCIENILIWIAKFR